jgi:hypothetical protein
MPSQEKTGGHALLLHDENHSFFLMLVPGPFIIVQL